MNIFLQIVSVYLFIATIMILLCAAYALAKGRTSQTRVFAVTCVLIGIYLFGYLLELNSSTLEQMLFWGHVQYFGLPFYPATWLILAIHANSKEHTRLRFWHLAFIMFVPFTAFIIRQTNELHYLFYSSAEIFESNGTKMLMLHKGPLYISYILYLGVLLVMSMILFTRASLINKGTARANFLMVAASVIPFIGLYLIIENPMGSYLDFTALLLPISVALLALALFRYDFLSIKGLARDAIFEQSQDAMILLDKKLRIRDFNSLAQSLFSELSPVAYNQPIEKILSGYPAVLKTIHADEQHTLRKTVNGHDLFLESRRLSILNNQGDLVGHLISLMDITEKRQAQEILNRLATTDGLTGLYNRTHFMVLADRAFAQAQRVKYRHALCVMDLDHFKDINDTYGHAAGDLVLENIGQLLRETFRNADIPGRLGGEEFIVLLTGVDISQARSATERFREKVAESPVTYEQTAIRTTISIGLTDITESDENLNNVIKRADQAVYQAKSAGRNCVVTVSATDLVSEEIVHASASAAAARTQVTEMT